MRVSIQRARTARLMVVLVMVCGIVSAVIAVGAYQGRRYLQQRIDRFHAELAQRFDLRVEAEDLEGGVFSGLTVRNFRVSLAASGTEIFSAREIRLHTSLLKLVVEILEDGDLRRGMFSRPAETIVEAVRRGMSLRIIEPVLTLDDVPVSLERMRVILAEVKRLLQTRSVVACSLEKGTCSVSKGVAPLTHLRGTVRLEERVMIDDMQFLWCGTRYVVTGSFDQNLSAEGVMVRVENTFIEGELFWTGTLTDGSVDGVISAGPAHRIPVSAVFQYAGGALTSSLSVSGRTLTGSGRFDPQDQALLMRASSADKESVMELAVHPQAAQVNGTLSHARVMGHDLVVSYAGTLVFPSATEGVKGEVHLRTVIFDYRPFPDADLFFRFNDGRLDVLSLDLGEHIRIYGDLELWYPFNVDAVIAANNIPLEEYGRLGEPGGEVLLTGVMTGKVEIKGPAFKPWFSGKIECQNGHIDQLVYKMITLNLKGEWPLVYLVDSKIRDEATFFLMSGVADLRRIGRKDFFNDILITTADKVIVMQGWEVQRSPGEQSITGTKIVDDDMRINFKAYVNEPTGWEPASGLDELELEYRLKGDKNLKMKIKKDESFIGAEHKITF